MFTIFNSESLWTGADLQRLNEIRNRLDEKKIPYKYKVYNHLGQWRGRGTMRGTMGSFGNDPAYMYQYEIIVHKKNYEQAKYLIG